MVKTITPFSTRAKEGATDSPLGDFVNVDQSIVSTAEVGFYDQNTGKLTGVQASDKVFSAIQLGSAIANGAVEITPSANADGTWPLDMTGFCDVALALKVSRTGNYAIKAILPPDIPFNGLSPTDTASTIQIIDVGSGNDTSFYAALQDAATSMDTVDVWKILMIKDRLNNQAALQFSVTNNSGGDSNIETAFMRFV